MEKKSELMFVLGQEIPSPRSVRFIISIHQGLRFVQRYVGRVGIDSNYRESNPGLCRLCHQFNGCIGSDPKDDSIVFAKAPVGH